MIRRLRKAGIAVGGAVLFVNVMMNVRPLTYLLVVLLDLEPELRDPQAASLAVTRAILSQQLADATEAYQTQLEHVRACENHGTDDETLSELREDLSKAQARMETAWLEHNMIASSAEPKGGHVA